MDARLQRRIQRYGWDLAADRYESLWQGPLAAAQASLLDAAALQLGERVLDVACGTGLVSFAAAARVGAEGQVLGVDLSARMIETARARAALVGCAHATFERIDAEALDLPDAGFDVALCALGLMYLPDADRAIAEMHRVLRPGGRAVLAVWGERARCGWSALFPIVDAEVESEVCPLFFRLGAGEVLARACASAGFDKMASHRLDSALEHSSDDEACDAAFVAGPVALAWSRFDAPTRARVRERYLQALQSARVGRDLDITGIVKRVTPLFVTPGGQGVRFEANSL